MEIEGRRKESKRSLLFLNNKEGGRDNLDKEKQRNKATRQVGQGQEQGRGRAVLDYEVEPKDVLANVDREEGHHVKDKVEQDWVEEHHGAMQEGEG